MVLLIGLAAYTRIETAVAGNTQRQAQARENALLALNVAIGHLQQFAGPDQRVTATAEAFPNANGTSRYTGVWHSDPGATASPATPLTWLVSGNELIDAEGTAQPLAITPGAAGPAATLIELVGRNTIGSTSVNANYIRAPLQPLTVKGLPGAPPTAAVPIGRYAWWVGDQGVKAPVAVPDTTDALNYPPYDSNEFRGRLRQQMSLGAGAADASSGGAIFDPRESNNAALVANGKITAFNQLAFLKRSGSTSTTVGQSLIRSNFHAWSPDNLNVLANTRAGGLRQDLSLAPGLLGSAFAAWANYSSYMESFVPPPPPEAGSEDPAPVVRSILPAYSAEPLRRRYPINGGTADGSVRVAPVLNEFRLLLGLRKETEASPFTLSLQWLAGLWNPYTSALVPEDLELEISGLPEEMVAFDAASGEEVGRFPLHFLYGSSLKLSLPWAEADSDVPQERSWLPGRVYNWTFRPDVPFTRDALQPGRFDSRRLEGFNEGLVVAVAGPDTVKGTTEVSLQIPAATLTVQLKRADGEVLGTYSSPSYEAVDRTAPDEIGDAAPQFGFVFRLAESVDTVTTNPGIWLSTPARDPRSPVLAGEAFVAPGGTNPASYGTWNLTRAPDRLLDRDVTKGLSYNEDVPVFELPRRPFLSLGELQHFFLAGARPFAFGNPWSAEIMLNGAPALQSFDRFFFSGVTAEVNPAANSAGDLILPNRLLRPIRKPDTSKVTADEFRAAPDAFSSRHVMQAGSFNLNSSNVAAWAAVLRGVRFPVAPGFTFLAADPATGTGPDTTTAVQSVHAQFFRFPQSAQEVYQAESEYVQSTPGTEVTTANTHLFRQGMRTLSPDQVAALAARISELIRQKHADSGPFRSVEEFLSPLAIFAVPGAPAAEGEEPPPAGPPRSLLESAIEAAGVNGAIAEFSSQWLTQADIMTALAPVLFPRSDTFVIRAYGEAINPAKMNATNNAAFAAAVEGRAWCEAIVQRIPEFMDPSAPPETPLAAFSAPADPEDPESTPTEASRLNATYGRRFKVVSFRWLTRSDI